MSCFFRSLIFYFINSSSRQVLADAAVGCGAGLRVRRAAAKKNAAELTFRVDVYMCRTSAHHSTRGGSPSPPPPLPPAMAVHTPIPLEQGRSKQRCCPPEAGDDGNMIAVFLLVVATAAGDDTVPWDRGSCTNAVVARPRRSTDAVAIAAAKCIAGEDPLVLPSKDCLSAHSHCTALVSPTFKVSIFRRVSNRQ